MSEIEIKKLVFPENIRQKVGMYLGDSTTPTTAIREIIDNSIDEAINKFANNIRVVIDNKTYWSSSADNGRGIPIYLDEHHDDDREITLDLFTMTHVGGKFEAEEASLGTHGVGTKGTNATSNHFIVLVNIDRNKNTKTRPKWVNEKYVKGSKSIYILHFQKGLFTYKDVLSYSEVLTYLESIDNNTLGIVPPTMDDWSSLVLVRPDETIFSSLVTKYSDRELRLAKLLYPEINIEYNGTTIEPFSIQSDSFRNTKFIEDKVFTIELDYENKYDYHGNPRTSKNKFVMAFGYSSDDYSHLTDGSVNTLDTPDGFHVNLVNRLVQRAFKDKFNDMDLKDATYGLRVFTLLLTNSAEYTSQDKTKLGRVYGVDFDSVLPLFKTQFNKIVSENSDYFESLILRINEYKMTIGTLSQKNYVKSVVIMGDDRRSKSLGAQMFDCSTKDRSKAELYIVEGKSAAGGIVQSRDPKIHAILPLRGKIFNSSNSELEDALKNKELLTMINCIGVGVSPYVDLTKARYGRIVIASDADCVSGDTGVWTLSRGFVPISKLYDEFINGNLNEETITTSPEGIHSNAKIINVIKKTTRNDYSVIVIAGEELVVTNDHKIMMIDGSYKDASEVEEGDKLMPFNNEDSTVTLVYNVTNGDPVDFYDLTVDNDNHNFPTSAGVFVHNCDGSHIQLLVLGAFAKFLPEVIESGMLYLGLAPLYEQKVDGKPKYFWSDNEHELNKSKAFSRYKGLGSTNPRQLRDTLLNPDSRRLIQITPEGIDKAIQLLQDSYLRRELMVENGVLDLNTIQDISDDQIEEIIEYSVDQLTDDEINLIEEGL